MKCIPCSKTDPVVGEEELPELLAQIPEWRRTSLDETWVIERTYRFEKYLSGAAFVRIISEESEREGHHPEICLGWKWVRVRWWTHVLKGVHVNDFILAARTEKIYREFSEGEN